MDSFLEYISSPKDDQLLGMRLPQDTKLNVLHRYHESDYNSLSVFVMYLVLRALEKDLDKKNPTG